MRISELGDSIMPYRRALQNNSGKNESFNKIFYKKHHPVNKITHNDHLWMGFLS
jgi:hypothetical protein